MIRPAPHRISLAIVFGALLALYSGLASAQAPSPAAPQNPDQAAAEPQSSNPGLLNEIGRLFGKPVDLFSSLKLMPETAAPLLAPSPLQPGDTTGMTPPPAAALPAIPPATPVNPAPTTAMAPAAPAKLPTAGLVPQLVQGRTTCPASANGAPDCKAGADKLCNDKGFAGGSSIGTDSAKTCSTKALLDGARHIRDICKTETFVTRAICR